MGAGATGSLVVCSAALLAGCNVDLSGLEQIVDPDPSYLNLPGRQVRSGAFSNVGIRGNNSAGAYLIADEDAGGTPTFAVVPFEGSGSCNAGPIDRSSWWFNDTEHTELALPFKRTTSGVTHLHFVNQHCDELLPPIATDDFPLGQNLEGLVSLERDADLVLLAPWDRKQRTLARGVRDVTSVPEDAEHLWTLESAPDHTEVDGLDLVTRDERARVVGRIERVQDFGITAYRGEEGYMWHTAFVRDGELHVASSPDLEASAPIDTDVCKPRFALWEGISYLSPCDSRTLNFYGIVKRPDGELVTGDWTHVGNQKYVLKAGVVGDAVFYPSVEGRGIVLLAAREGTDPEAVTLWGGYVDEELERIGESPLVDGAIRFRTLSDVDGKAQLFMNVVGDVSRLVRWKPGSEVRQMAAGIRECEQDICLANFDGTTGDAVQVSFDGSVRTLASGVPRGGIQIRDLRIALLADYDADAGAGTLMVGSYEGQNFEKIATGVPKSGFRFLRSLKGIAYLRDFRPTDGTGLMGVRVLDTSDTFESDVRASEFLELGWPRAGLLYVVPSGTSQGIWFASIR